MSLVFTSSWYLRHPVTMEPGPVGAIALWMQPAGWNSGDSTWRPWFAYGTNGQIRLTAERYLDNNIYIGLVRASEQRVILSDAGLFTALAWRGFVFQWDCAVGNAWLYSHDGALLAQASATYGYEAVSGSQTIGNQAEGLEQTNSHYGAEFARWNRLLSVGEISRLLRSTKAGAAPSPQSALWFPTGLVEYVPCRPSRGRSAVTDAINGRGYSYAGPNFAAESVNVIDPPLLSSTRFARARSVAAGFVPYQPWLQVAPIMAQ
jgi:hypothetical protein